MTRILLALICAAGVAACASNPTGENPPRAAAPTSQQPEKLAAADTNTGPRLVCKREKPIGSNRVVKTCRTRDEWNDQARRTQDSMMGDLGGSGGCVDCGGDGG